MNRIHSLILKVILTLLIGSPAFPATMHVIFVINTADKGIGCENDLKNWESLIPEIRTHTGLKIETHYLKDSKWSDSDVTREISQLKPAPDDVVLFYYSGHGFRFQEGQKDEWPWLALQDSSKSLYSVYSSLYQKKARLLLVIADCCNSYCPGSPPKVEAKAKVADGIISENYKNLFVTGKGAVLASGCIPGQYSWGGDPDGGAFTSTLLKNIRLSVRGEKSTWKQIFDESNKLLVGGKQQPQYKMDIDPGNSVINSVIADNNSGGTHGTNNAGGDVSFDDLLDPGWCTQATDTRNIFNNALVLLEAEHYLPSKKSEYKKLLEYVEMQYGFVKKQLNDKASEDYWKGCIDMVKASSLKKLDQKAYDELTGYLKEEQKQWLKVINQQACKKKKK